MTRAKRKWARQAAERLLIEFENAAAIDTANYQLCGFILAAATVAIEDDAVAQKIGDLMEPERVV